MAANASDHAAREKNMIGRLAGKTTVISGCAAGMERVTFLLFAKAGAYVAIIDIQQAAGRETVGMSHDAGARSRQSR